MARRELVELNLRSNQNQKKQMKKMRLIIGLAAAMLAGVTVHAGFGGYSPYNITNNTVTAPVFVTNYAYVNLPPIAFTATATNLVTRTTNSIIQGIPGTTYTNQFTFVYDSGIYGTNFSTNFPAMNYAVPTITGFQAVPQSTGASNLCQETFN
jgi:hypothetical protein